MDLGERVRERMKALNISQSELARRVGVSQPTINNLINRSKRGSTHLHKVARELGTTAEYLTGETDDPGTSSPMSNVLVLDSETRELLRLLERMTPADRRALVQVARSMAKAPATSGTLHERSKGFRHKGE
jgi:transcriptional regulator with XRE-family HTH domain